MNIFEHYAPRQATGGIIRRGLMRTLLDFIVAKLADAGLIATDVLECEWAH